MSDDNQIVEILATLQRLEAGQTEIARTTNAMLSIIAVAIPVQGGA